jgi:hypothetical protein
MFNFMNGASSDMSQMQSQMMQMQTEQMQRDKQMQQFDNAKTSVGVEGQNAKIDILKSVRL